MILVSDMVICIFSQCYNELSKGNLKKWFKHVKGFAEIIAVYDDGSTDGSDVYLERHVDLLIKGGINNLKQETLHKQLLLEKCLAEFPNIDWFFWLDIDEILDASGTKNIKNFCEQADKEGYFFDEITLWRSNCWKRTDYLGSGKFLRLWKNNGKLHFKVEEGLHKQLYPKGLNNVGGSGYNVIHYGYSNLFDIIDRWFTRNSLGVSTVGREKCVDEKGIILEHVDHDCFPELCRPNECVKPEIIKYDMLMPNYNLLFKEGKFKIHISLTDNIFPHKILRKIWVLTWANKIGGEGIDVGSGNSRMSSQILAIDKVAHGDIIPDNAYICEADVVCDIIDGLPKNNLDFIIASHVLEHIPEEKILSVVQNWISCLKGGGYIIIIMPNPDIYKGGPSHHKMFKMPELVAWLSNFSIDIVEAEKSRLHQSEYGLVVKKNV